MQTTGQGQTQPVKPQSPKPRPPKPDPPPPEFQAERIEKLGPDELVALLKKSEATAFEKAKACQRLGVVGTKDAVPAVAALLTDPQMSHYGRYALESIPDPAADDALRAALPKVKGVLLVGVINSISQRRDAKAVAPLAKLLYEGDVEVARASAAALGRIGGAAGAKVLMEGLNKTKGPVRSAVADASLVCAEGFLAAGQRAEAMALYNTLTAADVPKPVRLAAMHSIIGAETSLRRPR